MAGLRDTGNWQKALVGLLAANLLMVVVLAASPQLHQIIHPDADCSQHECAVTVMLSGGSDGSSPPPVFEAVEISPIILGFRAELLSRDVASVFLGAHIFEHAPPLA